jgi:hypothetical protein
MAKTKGSFQSLGNGVYRVGGVQRSAITGRYVSKSAASRWPGKTVVENQLPPSSSGSARPQ